MPIIQTKSILAAGYQKHGVSRNFIRSLLISELNINPIYRPALKNYYLLFWSPEWFFNKMIDGRINQNGQIYWVIYKDCVPTDIRNLFNSGAQISLSFRTASDEYNLPSYVMVSLINPVIPTEPPKEMRK